MVGHLRIEREAQRKTVTKGGSSSTRGESFIPQAAAIRYFGTRASRYRVSPSHSNQDVLRNIVEMVGPRGDELLLDIGTGPGHTAVAFAPYVAQAIATDLTLGMLREVPLLTRGKGVSNVVTAMVDVHHIPFRDETFDLVTCRSAAHHFTNIEMAVREMARVCGKGGKVFVGDQCSPEGREAASFINTIERLRDSSHVWNHRQEAWVGLFEEAGLAVEQLEISTGRYTDMEEWMDRSDTPLENRCRIYDMLAEAPAEVRREVAVGQQDGRWFWATRGIRIIGARKG